MGTKRHSPLSVFNCRRGVYRFRHAVEGCDVGYAVNDRRQIIGVRLVRPGESSAAAVVDLAAMTFGADVFKPILTLHRDGRVVDRRAAGKLLLGLAARAPIVGVPAGSPAR
jgi:hypothetical protein